jgi:hypothetical protein
MLFKKSVHTSKRTPNFTITKINFLMLFKEIIAVYIEKHAKPRNTKCSITDCQSRWFIQLPLGLKGLVSPHVLPSLCVTSFLTCCSHVYLSLPLDANMEGVGSYYMHDNQL